MHQPFLRRLTHSTEEQISRVVFMIIMGAAVLFIAAILFVSHM